MASPAPRPSDPQPPYLEQPRRPSPYAWSAAAPLLTLPGIVLILVALGLTWGRAVGGSDWTLCYNEPLSYELGTAEANRSLWPLGIDCVYGAGTTDAFTVYEDTWFPTILAIAGLAIAGLAIAGLAVVAAGIVGTITAYTHRLRR